MLPLNGPIIAVAGLVREQVRLGDTQSGGDPVHVAARMTAQEYPPVLALTH